MQVEMWGVRGSIPVPGAQAAGFGGNTSCVAIPAGERRHVILDAGTGIRPLGARIASQCEHADVLLTHLHLDHIQGLLFFQPLFEATATVTVWGPPAYGRALRDRLARLISSPLAAIELRDLSARITFRDVPPEPWRLGDIEIASSLVLHSGPTLGYRLTQGSASVCYLPDHEPGLGEDLDRIAPDWISGHELARGASLLIHDAQYHDEEYRPRRGWGHSCMADAITFARRAEAERVVLFHHDPDHDDATLQALEGEARERWVDDGGDGERLELAREGAVYEV